MGHVTAETIVTYVKVVVIVTVVTICDFSKSVNKTNLQKYVAKICSTNLKKRKKEDKNVKLF